jgi:hypothetical protein
MFKLNEGRLDHIMSLGFGMTLLQIVFCRQAFQHKSQ